MKLSTAITASLFRGDRLFLTEAGNGLCWQIITDNSSAVFRRDELIRLRDLIDEKVGVRKDEKL